MTDVKSGKRGKLNAFLSGRDRNALLIKNRGNFISIFLYIKDFDIKNKS